MWVGKSALFLLLLISSILQAQEVEDWRSIRADQSRDQFTVLEQYFEESYNWPIPERIAYLDRLCESGKALQNDSLLCKYARKLGLLYIDLDSIAPAFEVLDAALTHSFSPNDKFRTLNILGGLYRKGGDFDTAIAYFLEALEEAEKVGGGLEAFPIGNMSEVYAMLGDYESAIKYLSYSVEFSKKLSDLQREYSLIFDYSTLLSSYLKINARDDAAHTLGLLLDNLAVIDTITRQREQDACFVGYKAITNYYIDYQQPDQAEIYLAKMRHAAQAVYLSSVYVLKAKIELLKGNPQAALAALEKESEGEDYPDQLEFLELKAQCYQNMGNYQLALELKEQQLALQESQMSDDHLRYSSFANAKYDLLQKSREIEDLRQDQEIKTLTIKSQYYYMLLGIAVLALVGAIGVFYWRQFQNRKRLSTLLEQEIQAKTKDLRETNEELRILNYVASHDMKEPIRNIGTYISLIRRKLPAAEQDKMKDYFEIVDKGVRQMYSLIEDVSRFLSLPKLEEKDLIALDMEEIVQTIITTSKSYIEERKAEVETCDLPTITTNSAAIFILFRNIIENAIKFNSSLIPTVKVSYVALPAKHKFVFSDNGIGIDQRHFAGIFEGFNRLHSRDEYEGSGIGLTVVKLLTEKLGGTVRVESELEKGTDIIVELPIVN